MNHIQLLGAFLISVPFIGIFIAMVVTIGWKAAFGIFGFAAMIIFCVVVGVALL